jgi:hypothetical protein
MRGPNRAFWRMVRKAISNGQGSRGRLRADVRSIWIQAFDDLLHFPIRGAYRE